MMALALCRRWMDSITATTEPSRRLSASSTRARRFSAILMDHLQGTATCAEAVGILSRLSMLLRSPSAPQESRQSMETS